MSELIQFLTNLSPLGLAGILALIVYLQVKNAKHTAQISDNHLSGLPEMQATLEQVLAALSRMEERQVRAGDQLTYLLARTNGAPKPPG